MAKTKLEQINDNVTKNGYLKEVNVEEGEEEILLERVERYEHLLRRSVFAFLGRIVYPIKV